MTALLMPALMAAAGVASDTLHWTLLHRMLQRQAETAALAGAAALAQHRAVDESVRAQLSGPSTLAATPVIEIGPSSGPHAGDPLVVRVRLAGTARLPFAGLFSAGDVPIRVEATAGLVEERAATAIDNGWRAWPGRIRTGF